MSFYDLRSINIIITAFTLLVSFNQCGREVPDMNDRAYVDAASGLRLRTEPGLANSKVILLIKKGNELTILDRNGPEDTIENITGKWYRVEFQGSKGWVFSPYLRAAVQNN